MSFTSRNGTRGARQPRSSGIVQWFNQRAIKRIKRKGGKVMGMNALVLSTVGKKSGVERETPVAWFPGLGPGDSWIIVASANGAAKNPAWYYNLAAHPDRVSIAVGGSTIPVTAVELHGDERAEAWKRIISLVPRFADYETKTDRSLPVIQLTRRG